MHFHENEYMSVAKNAISRRLLRLDSHLTDSTERSPFAPTFAPSVACVNQTGSEIEISSACACLCVRACV
jgi:hypothetical protein